MRSPLVQIDIRPLSATQAAYLEVLADDRVSTVLCLGVAGAGKTLLTVKAALDWLQHDTLNRKQVVLTRQPLNAYGRTMEAPLEDINRPALDAIEQFGGRGQGRDGARCRALRDARAGGARPALELRDWSTIRGLTFRDNFVIADEATNSSMKLLELLCSRVADSSKLVIIGDPDQFDHQNPHFEQYVGRDGRRVAVLEKLAEQLEAMGSEQVSGVHFGS